MKAPNFEKDCQIDDQSLDIEWLEQASLGIKYCKYLAYLKDKQRQLEEEKKTIRSELILQANREPAKCCGKDKPNAADIEAFYRVNTRYQEVVEELNNVTYEAEFAEMAKTEICWTRKSALENLVKLHGLQYFAGPSVPRDLQTEYREYQEQKNKKVDTGISETLKRVRK